MASIIYLNNYPILKTIPKYQIKFNDVDFKNII